MNFQERIQKGLCGWVLPDRIEPGAGFNWMVPVPWRVSTKDLLLIQGASVSRTPPACVCFTVYVLPQQDRLQANS